MFNPIVDLIVGGALIFFFAIGWANGFIRTIIGPIALVVGSIIAWIYFKQTEKLLVSLLISLIAPFIIQFIVLKILKAFKKRNEESTQFFSIGSLLGGILNLAWGSAIVLLVFLLLALAPLKWLWLGWVQEEIKTSYTYSFLNRVSGNRLDQGKSDIEKTVEVLRSSEKMQALKDDPEYEEIMDHKKMQAIFNDKELVKDLEEKNFTKLMNNPKIIALVQDPELVKKLVGFYKYFPKQDPSEKKSEPKVINVK